MKAYVVAYDLKVKTDGLKGRFEHREEAFTSFIEFITLVNYLKENSITEDGEERICNLKIYSGVLTEVDNPIVKTTL